MCSWRSGRSSARPAALVAVALFATTPAYSRDASNEIGWTAFQRAPDTRTIYVSSSSGNDANDGSRPQQPVKTLRRGYALLRNRHPDWLLLKRGDEWRDEGFSPWKKSGQSAREPLLLGAYGEGTRPLLLNGFVFYSGKPGETVSHLRVVSLDFYARSRDPLSEHYAPTGKTQELGFYFVGAGEDILLEDCRFRFYNKNVIFQRWTSAPLANIRLRRCVVADSYATKGHSQGAYFQEVEGLVLEENLFDHNGWNETVDRAVPTIFNHNIYLKECSRVTLRGNILARASSFGSKQSSNEEGAFHDLLIEGNLYVANGNGLSLDHSGGMFESYTHKDVVVRGNVFTRIGREIGRSAQSFGVWARSLDGGLIENNYFIDKPFGGTSFAVDLEESKPHRNVTIRGNVVYRWKKSTKEYFTVSSLASNAVVEDNATDGAPERFVDPLRSIDSYHRSISSGSDRSLDAFLRIARDQTKGSWREEYTAAAVVRFVADGFRLVR